MTRRSNLIYDPPDDLPWFRPRELRNHKLPRPIVVVNGAFDILHSGHAKVIFAARRKARRGTVIAALDSDLRVNRKGIGRPVQSFVERATMLRYMPVDAVVEIDSDRDMTTLLTHLRPDLRVQGYDYSTTPSRFPHIPKLFVRGTGMRTTEIIKRCQNVKW